MDSTKIKLLQDFNNLFLHLNLYFCHMSLIVQIETATEVCSVSLAEDGKLIAMKETHESRSHAGVLATFINELLEENRIVTKKLSAVAVSMGPGSYTGLRIGVSIAKGLCYGAGIPLIAVSTLESMYLGLLNQLKAKGEAYDQNALFAPMIDARRMEVYTCLFNTEGRMLGETQALILDKDIFRSILKDHKVFFFGSGADKFTPLLEDENARFINNFTSSSADMVTIAYQRYRKQNFENLAYFEPYYLKDFITTIPKKKFI
jgi:tRNA threonylcarbamoyladenosine biosynthesis protein TsaB